MSVFLSRTTRGLLLVSLVLNVVLGSWLWMHAPWRHADERGARHAPVPQMPDLRAFRRALPEDRQPIVEQAFRAHREAMRSRIGELFAARRAVSVAILAEPFDRAALDAAFANLRDADARTASEAQALLGDVLAVATPAERRQLAELVPQRGRGGRRERAPRDPDDAR